MSLQKDRGDYQSLTAEQKHIYTSNLKYQIMLDSVQGKVLEWTFIPFCSLLNWRQVHDCVGVYGDDSFSLLHIYHQKRISRSSEIFDTITEDPENILRRASTVTSAYNDFINAAQLWGSGNQWEHALEDCESGPSTNGMNSKENSIEQSQTSTSWKELGSMSPSHVRSHLANLRLYGRIGKNHFSYRRGRKSTLGSHAEHHEQMA